MRRRVFRPTYNPVFRRALADVSFTVAPASFTALLGLNGAGKSTLFSLITRLFGIKAGRISIFGHDIRAAPAFLCHPHAVPVCRVKVFLGPQAKEIPAHAFSFVHLQPGQVSKGAAVDGVPRTFLQSRERDVERLSASGRSADVRYPPGLVIGSVEREVRRQELLEQTDAYLAELVAEVGDASASELARAEAIARRIREHHAKQAS